uniref:helix-turn-helix domain-containing protein n=1 Tax=Variovorax sp. YR752 TaxID=1884383 RepID=UPI003137DFDA
LPPELMSEGAARVAAPVAEVAAPAGGVAVEPLAMPPVPLEVAPVAALAASGGDWLAGLEQEARQMLQAGAPEVWDALTRKFEARMIHTALDITRGRRIEAAQKLGIGRNTITRKIQELDLDD